MGRKRTCFSWARTPLPFPDLSFHLSSFLLPSSQATDLSGPGEEAGNRRKEGKHAGEAMCAELAHKTTWLLKNPGRLFSPH